MLLKLMRMTCAPLSAAHKTPETTSLSQPVPSVRSTCTGTTLAPLKATPAIPTRLFTFAAAIPATSVP